MTVWTILRFFGVLGVLALMTEIWPSVHLGLFDLLLLAVVLALVDLLMSLIVGMSASAKNPSIVGWMVSVGMLYGAQWVLPHVRMSAAAALIGGTVLWLWGRLFPAVFG